MQPYARKLGEEFKRINKEIQAKECRCLRKGCAMLKHCKSRNDSVLVTQEELDGERIASSCSNTVNGAREERNSKESSCCDLEVKRVQLKRPKSSLSWITDSTMLTKTEERRIEESIGKDDCKEAHNHLSFVYRYILLAAMAMAFVLGITVAIGVIYIVYYPDRQFLNTGDMLVVDYSTYFCSAVSTTSSSVWLTTLVDLDRRKEVHYTMSGVLRIDVGQLWGRMFYLHKNSSLSIVFQCDELIHLFVFEHKHTFDIWAARKTSESYLIKRDSCFSKDKMDDIFNFVSDRNSDYYFAFYRPASFGRAASLNLTMTFRRPSFDFGKTVANCHAAAERGCSVPLSFGSNEKTVIEVPNTTKRGIPREIEAEWKCEARVWFYVVVFGSGFVVVCAIFFLIFSIHKYARKRSQMKIRSDDCTVLANDVAIDQNSNNHNFSNGFAKGPVPRDAVSYESIENYHNWALDEEDWADVTHETLKSGDSFTPSERMSRSASEIAVIYNEKTGARMSRLSSNASIVKYVARKPRKQSKVVNEKESASNMADNEEVILSLQSLRKDDEPINDSPSKNRITEEDRELFLHPALTLTRSTGYFRVLSPIIQKKTGQVTGQRERRTPNPVFYRPGSQESASSETITVGKPIDI